MRDGRASERPVNPQAGSQLFHVTQRQSYRQSRVSLQLPPSAFLSETETQPWVPKLFKRRTFGVVLNTFKLLTMEGILWLRYVVTLPWPYLQPTIYIQEILDKLDIVTKQLNIATEEKVREVSDLTAELENEQEARRGWQNKATTLRERVLAMVSYRYPNHDL